MLWAKPESTDLIKKRALRIIISRQAWPLQYWLAPIPRVAELGSGRIRAMKPDWKTWSPFQSPVVRDICAHMTDAGKSEASRRGGRYGCWVAATFAVPLAFAMVERSLLFVIITVVLVAIHVGCIPVWQRMQRRFLCSTTWAREQGVTPDRLKIFAFR